MPENTGNISRHASANNTEQKATQVSGLTARQRQLLMFIRAYSHYYGIPPSFDEMAQHLELSSKSGVHRLVHALAARGHIRFDKARARSIVLTERSDWSVADAIDVILSSVDLTSGTREELLALLPWERR